MAHKEYNVLNLITTFVLEAAGACSLAGMFLEGESITADGVTSRLDLAL